MMGLDTVPGMLNGFMQGAWVSVTPPSRLQGRLW